MRSWGDAKRDGAQLLAAHHARVFGERSWATTDRWMTCDSGQLWTNPLLGSKQLEASDCRWGNAIALMSPRGER